jgi:succinate dehydrogenase / fumarate reductase cytochrome b subunit
MTLRRFFSSSVGTKILIALTGLAFFGFLITHLAGNLLILVSADSFNGYSHTLTANPLLPLAELGLLAIFVLHVVKAIGNYASNKSARPAPYEKKARAGHTSRKSLSSTTMIFTGSIILIFTVLHIAMFKYGTYYEDAVHKYRDLNRLVVETFANPLWVGFYVLSMVVIGFHLRHGLSSACQSLGLSQPRYSRTARIIGTVLAVLIAGGFAMIPLWVFFTGGRS